MSTKYIISGDSHIIEPFDLWSNVLADKRGDKLPQVVEGYKNLPGQFFFTGIEYLKVDLLEPAAAAESSGELKGLGDELEAKVKLCNTDSAVRVELMDYDGIVAEVINSTFMLLNMRMEEVTVLLDVCQVYNDWIAEYCSHDPKRLLGAAMIDMHDPNWATAELNRIAKKGLRTAIPQNALRPQFKPYRDPSYDSFWSAAQDLDMPITFHSITGQVRDPFTYHTADEIDLAPAKLIEIFDDIGPIVTQEFIFGRLFDRFPNLKLIFGEYEVSWLPLFLFRLKQIEGAFGRVMNLAPLKHTAEEYMATRVWHTFVDDPYVDRAWDVEGANQIIWGSDFPHLRNTFPRTHEIMEDILGELPPKVQADISALTCAKLYDIALPAEVYAVAAE